jgi:hypothetical protein
MTTASIATTCFTASRRRLRRTLCDAFLNSTQFMTRVLTWDIQGDFKVSSLF